MIELTKVTFRYPESDPTKTNIIQNLDLSISEGEYIALIGANGSGKTTLARLIARLLRPSSGTIHIDVDGDSGPRNSNSLMIPVGLVFQNAEDQIVATTVEEDVAFGLENLGVPREEIVRRVEHSLSHMGLLEVRSRPSYLLSAGQTQRLAIAGVTAIEPACIIFDEPTAQLDPLGRDAVLAMMKELHQAGCSIIHITHTMREACEAERVLVMKRGEVVLDDKPADIFTDFETIHELNLEIPQTVRFANEINRLFPRAIKPGTIDEGDLLAQISALPQSRASSNFPESTDPKENDPILVVEALKHWYMRGTPQEHPALSGVDMAVKRGSAHGLIGRTGAGKSTLLQHLNGLLRPQSGTVVIDSKSMNDPKIKLSDVIQKAGLVMQNPEMQFFEHFVGDEIAYGPRTIGCDQPLAERVFWAMEMVGLDFDNFKDREIHTLSGGEKRKVALASLLAIKPSILLLDEPLASLDPRSHDEIRAKLGDLRKEGITLVLSSHNMEDIGFLTQCTTVLSDGASIVTKKTSELLQDESILNQASLKLPFSMKVARGLSKAGLNVSQDICTADGLIRYLRTIRREYDD